MGYKDEIYTFNGTAIVINEKLKAKMEYYLPQSDEKKMFHGQLCNGYNFEIVKNAMNNFFHDKEVQEIILPLNFDFTFTTFPDSIKYYYIQFGYNHGTDTIFPINIYIDSSRQVGTFDL